MKITRYAMMLAAATGLLSACQKLDEVKAYDPDKVVAPVLHALPGEIVITPDNMGSTQTFTWDAADFGVRTQINYSIEASYNDGAKLVLFTGMNGTSSEQTYESLNNILALSVEDGGLGVPSGEPTDVDFYISATIGTDFEKFYSAPATVRMTVTTAERTYPQVWVIGDYCGWNFDNAQGLFCFSGDEVTYEAIVDLGEKAANGFKLSGEAGWNDACNWGTDGDAAAPETEAPSITLISSGGSGNIMVYSKRFYRFVFDRSTLTLSNKLSFNSMGIIGDATPGGWDTDTEMNFDTQKQRFWVDVTLTAGEFKFRADNDWAINFGGADGRLSQNGDNIKATAGNYRVYATLNNSAEITYELNAGDYGTGGGEEPDPGPEKADWYIHGQTVATPDWGPTAMESASSNIVAYKAAGVEVAANSEFLFKSGDESQWIGADAAFAGSSPYTCTIGSAFKVSADKVNAVIAEAGTYDYWLLPEAGRAYVMAAGGSRLLDLRTDAGAWSLTQSDNTAWCTPALTSGKTSTSFAVTAIANESSKRSATLTFTAPGCDPVVVTVTQSGDASQDFEGEQVVAQPDAWDNRKRADISYQLLVYSFADGNGDKVGDLPGLTRRLDYIDALGASAVWLSPIHPAASYHGYDVLDYEAVNPAFGTDADLRAFIDAAHARGIRVYLDYVLNHTGKDHPWFKSAAASEGSPYRDRYIFSEDPQADIAAGRIDQIATEGAAGYDAGQWFSTDTGAGAAGRFKFVLDWTNADSPTVTVTETTDAADADNTQGGADDKYLYFGNGTSKRFYARGGNSYELTLDFDSDWGFLVRTSTTSWAAGTKYGAPDNRTIIRFGEPFTLMSNRSADPANVQFSLPTMYHSHFWTAAFADLNYGKAAEAEQSRAFKAVAEAADKWVRMGVDGFRLDAVKHIYHNAYNDENPTFLKKFYDRMNETYKAAGGEGDFYMVGEMLDEADKAAPYYRGLPALFEFTFWYKLKWALQNGIGCYFVKDILDVQPLYAQYRSDYIEATKLSNHDEDRTGSDLGQSVEKMKVAAAVLLTAQGAPYIYQGEELGYWGTKSNGDEYVRTPILWDKAGNELASGSLSGKIDMQMLTAAISVEAQADDDGSLLNLYRTFARLRNTYPVLAQGKMVKHPVYNDGNTSQQSIAAWYRELDGERMLVVHNFGQETQILTLTDQPDKAVGVSGEVKLQRGDASSKLLMGAWSSVVFAL